jgi:hypothetical protein
MIGTFCQRNCRRWKISEEPRMARTSRIEEEFLIRAIREIRGCLPGLNVFAAALSNEPCARKGSIP